MDIRSLTPPVNTTKLRYPKRSDVAVAGSETNKDAPQYTKEEADERRHGRDRRKRREKPLVECRSGDDRRKKAKIDIKA